jgi:hypothetical protein
MTEVTILGAVTPRCPPEIGDKAVTIWTPKGEASVRRVKG